MKVCKKCGQSVQDVETYCPRCGSTNLVADAPQRAPIRPQQRPMPNQNQGAPMGNGNPSAPRRAPAPNQMNNGMGGMPGGNGAPSQYRQPQQAPPGYRNPNAAPQTQPNRQPGQPGQPQQQQFRQQANPNMGNNNHGYTHGQPMPGQRPPVQRPQQAPYQSNLGNFNSEIDNDNDFEPVDTSKKKRFSGIGLGKGKQPNDNSNQPKTSKFPKLSKNQPQDDTQSQAVNQQAPNSFGVPYDTSNNSAMNMGFSSETVTMKEWLIMILKLLIPIYNIIFLIKAWKGIGVKPSMHTYLKLYTIILLVSLAIGLALSIISTVLLSMMF